MSNKLCAQVAILPIPYAAAAENYVRTFDASAPERDANAMMGKWIRDVKISTQYFDGLGRPLQTVIKQGSFETGGSGFADLVSPNVYDAFGREPLKYLLFAANNTGSAPSINDGKFKLNPFQQQQTFMQQQYAGQGETYFYSKTNFEASPLNRPEKSMSPGDSWVGSSRGIEMKYWINTLDDDVKIWQVTNNSSVGTFGIYQISTNSNGKYPAGELYKNVHIDEHGKQAIEFKDKEGNVILKKVQLTASADDGTGRDHRGWLCTYYIYDDLNNLRCVVQPEAVKRMSNSGNWNLSNYLSEQCFRYEYDTRSRMIMKKVPGAAEVYMVYDSRDRLVMVQDANLRIADKWMVTLYDALNRAVQTGLLKNNFFGSNSKTFSQHLVDAAANTSGYPFTPAATPAVSYWEYLSKMGYDDYGSIPSASGLNQNFDNTWISYFFTNYNASPDYPQQQIASQQTKGMVTSSETKVIATGNYIYSVYIYDDKGRLIQTKTKNITGGTDIATTQFGWSGQPLVMLYKHQNSGSIGQEHVVVTKMEYDDLGRVSLVKKELISNVNGTVIRQPAQTILENEYDKLGQLKSKKLAPAYNNNVGLETLGYEYNIRGWMLGMNRGFTRDEAASNGKYFGFDLGYDKQNNGLIGNQTYAAAQYNGNISGMVWKSKGDKEKRKYDYVYDAANRLLKADFTQYTSGSFNQNANVNYNVKMGDGLDISTAYDDNGNIKKMQHWGLKIGSSAQIDNLEYTYFNGSASNRLSSVKDLITDASNGGLGDFKDGTNANDDYNYDLNGNLIVDQNKSIGNITYNHLNLPQVITIPGKGTITYTYDATGNKLKKQTVEANASVSYNGINYTNISITSTTNYIGGFVYESKYYGNNSTLNAALGYSDKLQFCGHEEGRVRALYNNASLPNTLTGFAYDYMLKDHLGNVRMLLTEEVKPASIYQAEMEDANRAFENQLFSRIPETVTSNNKPVGFDADAGNKNVSVLYHNAAGDKRMGPGVVLKVMAGDRFKASVMGWYRAGSTSTSTYSSTSGILSGLLTALSGGLVGAGSKGSISELSSSTGVLGAPMTDFLNDPTRPNSSTVPKAYLNWVVLDETQFKLVPGNYGAVQIPAMLSTDQKKILQANAGNDITIAKNGYLYVYVSNESMGSVYFDKIRVEHTAGAMLEETHYYPFGLQMNGISSKVSGKLGNNKQKLQGQEFAHLEFSDRSGLGMYEFKYRMDDPLIGRFWQIDPLADKYRYNSTYAFSENKVTSHVELEGLEAISITKEDGTSGAMYGPYANQASSQRAYNETYTKQGGSLFVDNTGFAQSPRISANRVSKLERGAFKSSILGIVLHRTVSSTASSTISTFNTGREGINYGTHFVVDKDGTVMQTASLLFYTLHVGKTRKDEYPNNKNSIGIEVVGMYDEERETWEAMTQAQTESTAWLTNSLLKTYNLTSTNVYKHEQISYKTAGEGQVVYNAILQFFKSKANNNDTSSSSGDGRVIPIFW